MHENGVYGFGVVDAIMTIERERMTTTQQQKCSQSSSVVNIAFMGSVKHLIISDVLCILFCFWFLFYFKTFKI